MGVSAFESNFCDGPLALKGSAKALIKKEAVKEQLFTCSLCITAQNHSSVAGLPEKGFCRLGRAIHGRATSTNLKSQGNVPFFHFWPFICCLHTELVVPSAQHRTSHICHIYLPEAEPALLEAAPSCSAPHPALKVFHSVSRDAPEILGMVLCDFHAHFFFFLFAFKRLSHRKKGNSASHVSFLDELMHSLCSALNCASIISCLLSS